MGLNLDDYEQPTDAYHASQVLRIKGCPDTNKDTVQIGTELASKVGTFLHAVGNEHLQQQKMRFRGEEEWWCKQHETPQGPHLERLQIACAWGQRLLAANFAEEGKRVQTHLHIGARQGKLQR